MIIDNRYNEPMLKSAIIRIDFSSTYDRLANEMPKMLHFKVKEFYKIAEPVDTIGKHLQINANKVIGEKDFTSKEWHYFNVDRTEHLLISPDAYFIEVFQYQSFEDIFSKFSAILKMLVQTLHEDFSVKRIGVRYINEFEHDEINKIENWNEYFSEHIYEPVRHSLTKHSDNLIRSICIVESRHEEYMLRSQFGLTNRNYPSINPNNEFLLDFDAFAEGLFYPSEVDDLIQKMHSTIYWSFEDSITDNLRKVMGVIDGSNK